MNVIDRIQRILFITWFNFIIPYRRMALGPMWLLVSPSIFIIVIGILFSEVYGMSRAEFVPHLALGLIVWNLITGVVTASPDLFVRNRGQVLDGGMSLMDIVLVEWLKNLIQFAHQAILIIAIMIIFSIPLTFYSTVSLIGILAIAFNSVSVIVLPGMVGTRYLDIKEIISAVMRVAFFATPIMWYPAAHAGRGSVMGAFVVWNPFYHFIELVRAPLLGTPIAPLSWLVVLGFSVVGSSLAWFYHRLYAREIPLWV